MKTYINEIKNLNAVTRNIDQYMKDHRSQFANISVVLTSVDNILDRFGYHLVEPDGTHHRSVYAGISGNAEIALSDKSGNIINSRLILNWKIVDSGLGWKIDIKIK